VSVGIDLVDVERFQNVLTRRPSLVNRVFTSREQAESNGQPERLAARFAAKEAFLKSLGMGIGAARWSDIEVCRSASGAPSLAIRDSASILATASGYRHFDVSLTHTETTAGAVVIATR
jgi:holo-[acyl-carrier protein] synthase